MSAASGAGIALHKKRTNVIALRGGAPGLSDAVPQPASRTLADRRPTGRNAFLPDPDHSISARLETALTSEYSAGQASAAAFADEFCDLLRV
jgi:hypothetical protein